MYSKIVFLLILFAFIANFVFAQNKETAIWHVGNKCINFNTIPATVSETNPPFYGMLGGTEISDSNGNLLFFLSRKDFKLYDKNLNKLPHGDSISTHLGVFIPIPNSKRYYLISSNQYTIIDTELNGGFGDVTVKNFVWNNHKTCAVVAIRHANCKDYWFIIEGDTALYSYLITEKGVNTQAIITPKGYDDLTISSSGQYAMFSAYSSTINYGIFNRNTGKFEQITSYPGIYFQGTGISFSPDNTKLYYTAKRADGNISDFVQINIVNAIPDFEHQIILDSRIYGALTTSGKIQSGLDGKLYKCYNFYKKIDIVHHPNELGTACNFESNAISLTQINSDLPNFCTSLFSCNCDTLNFQATNLCLGTNTSFTFNTTNNIQSVLWNFGDGTTSTELNPSHTYTNSGTYTVQVSVNYADGTSQTLTKTITIIEKPKILTIKHN